MSSTDSVEKGCLRAPFQRDLFIPQQLATGKRSWWSLPEHCRRCKAWETDSRHRHKQEMLLHITTTPTLPLRISLERKHPSTMGNSSKSPHKDDVEEVYPSSQPCTEAKERSARSLL